MQSLKLIIVYFILIATYIFFNLVLGIEKIAQAKIDLFNGGYCGAAFVSRSDPKCQTRYGFEEWSLLGSFLILGLVIGSIHAFLPMNLFSNFKNSIIFVLLLFVIFKIVTHLFNIPTLYSHFTEGYQYFIFPTDLIFKIKNIKGLELYGIFMFNLFYLIGFMICIMIGNVIGYILYNLIKILKK